MIEIIEYDDQYADDFKKLNLEWLDKYHLTEERDIEVLENPREEILGHGGAIFLARSSNEIVGTAAIMKEGQDEFELAKMTVAPAWQGKGISKLLIRKCLEKAKELGAKKITLFSNHQLQTAIALYSKFGFKHVEVTDSPFLTADVKMELIM